VRHGEFEPDKAHSTVVGIISPPALVEIGLTVTQNLGKAQAWEALIAFFMYCKAKKKNWNNQNFFQKTVYFEKVFFFKNLHIFSLKEDNGMYIS
jgi:hypothetical protein